MHTIEKSAGQVIAADTQASVSAIDQAVMSCSRLCASIIEVSHASNLPVAAGQQALVKLSAGLSAVIEGRQHIAEAARELLKVQARSNLQTVGFGCPDGFPPLNATASEGVVSEK